MTKGLLVSIRSSINRMLNDAELKARVDRQWRESTVLRQSLPLTDWYPKAPAKEDAQ